MPTPRSRLQMVPARGGLGEGLVFQAPVAESPAPVVVVQPAAPVEAPAAHASPAVQPQAAAPVDTYRRETCNYTEIVERGTNRVVSRQARPGFGRPCSVGASFYSSLYDQYPVWLLNQWSTQIRLPMDVPARIGASATFNLGAGLVAGLHASVTPEQRLVDFPNLNMSSWSAGLTLVDRQGTPSDVFRPVNEWGFEIENTRVDSVDATLSPESIVGANVVRLNLVNRSSPLAFQAGPLHFGLRLNASPLPLATLSDGGVPNGRLDGQSVSDLYVLRNPLSMLELFVNYDFNSPSTSTNISHPPLAGHFSAADRVKIWMQLAGLTVYKVFALQSTVAQLVSIASSRGDAVGGGSDYGQLERASLFLALSSGGTTTRNIVNYSSWYLHNGDTSDRTAILIAAGLEMGASAAVGFIAPNAFGLDYYEPWASAARMNFFQDIGQAVLTGIDLTRDRFNYAERRRLNNPNAASLFGVGAGAGLVLGGGLILALTRGGYPAANNVSGGSFPDPTLEENVFRAERNISVATIGYTALFNGGYYIIKDLLLSDNRDLNGQAASPSVLANTALAANHRDAVYLNPSVWQAPARRMITGVNASFSPTQNGGMFRLGLQF